MLRVQSNTELVGFTEFEEVIHFDDDDPDFPQGFNTIPTMPIILGVRRDMSIASVHPAGLHSTHGSLPTLSHSVEDITECNWSPPTTPAIHHHHHHQSDHVLTIEELRLHMTSCFTCGVSWNDSHVSLDCSECGGYALDRPCPECEGACGAVWKRDLSMSHACSKARWQGECALKQQQQQKNIPPTSSDNNNQKTSSKAVVNSVSQELSSKLEKLSANS